MPHKPSFSAVLLLIMLLVFQGLAPDLQAQDMPPVPTPQQLDQLLAPIALYPDALLAQITTASTNPQEILDVDSWLGQNPNLNASQLTDAAQQQGFDPAFIALAGFPQVIQMMAENIDDYASIGAAVMADQGQVSAAVQRLRAQAYASGALRSSPQQQVEVQQAAGAPVYVIQPANPQVVYLPQYDPTVVYTGGAGPGLVTFGIAIGITALLVSQPWGWGGWGWNWGGRRIYYNRSPWGGWGGGYRPPRVSYRPRPVIYRNRPGYGGNWGYRPPNYRPPRPVNRPGNRPGYNRPIGGPGNRPGNGRPPYQGRPSIQPVRPGTPNNNRPVTARPTPGVRPPAGARPAPPNNLQMRPQPNRPPQQGRPTTMPNRPPQQGRPTTMPNRPPQQGRPAAMPNRPPQQSRPAAAPNRPQAPRPQGGPGGGGRPGGGPPR